MPTRDELVDWITDRYGEPEGEDGILLADGFESAFVGVGQCFSKQPQAIYDRDKCIRALVDGGASIEDAIEHFEYNVQGAWVGPSTPVFVTLYEAD